MRTQKPESCLRNRFNLTGQTQFGMIFHEIVFQL
jgi:hypothetical protein